MLEKGHPKKRIAATRSKGAGIGMDGFRFILARVAGHVMLNPPVIWDIESEPLRTPL
jgi:hypothetical protein